MGSTISRGAVSGLLAGAAFGFLLQMMTVPAPGGERVPAITLVALTVGSTNVLVGWGIHLFNGAIVGALFGAFPGRLVETLLGGLFWGALYGVAWWVLSSLVLFPLGVPLLAPGWVDAMGSVAAESLVGHLVYGLILGTCYDALRRPAVSEEPVPARERPATQAYMGSE